MRQKYLIQRDKADNTLIIKEYANLDREYKINDLIKMDKELFSLLCEETYDGKAMSSAIKEGKESLIEALRTPNLYPIGIYAEKIAESVLELFGSDNNLSVEILFDDKEFLDIKLKTAENGEEKIAATDAALKKVT